MARKKAIEPATSEQEEIKPAKKHAADVFKTPKGMHDVMPEEAVQVQYLQHVVDGLAEMFGYKPIATPILEQKGLFLKGTGETSDIVQKELYEVSAKGDEELVVRPEMTPGMVRAYLNAGMHTWPQPVKLYQVGPVFRHDRPQAGRYRQFTQIDFEVLGSSKAVVDAELIHLAWSILHQMGLNELTLQLNSLGDEESRKNYREALVNYFTPHKNKLGEDDKRRLEDNPLRILDSKDEKTKRLIENAPQTLDYLSETAYAHFKSVLEILDELDIPYEINARLVRGLDYYTKTVFEIWPADKPGHALAAGGRYDGLVEVYGGAPTPAIGFAAGVERILLLLAEKKLALPGKPKPQVFFGQLGQLAKKKSIPLYQKLYAAGIPAMQSFSRDSIKSQLKVAEKHNVAIALILGQKEATEETIILRTMRDGVQEVVPQAKMVAEVKRRLRELETQG